MEDIEHLSGLWIGEAVPDPSHALYTPSNPIQSSETNVFGTGFSTDTEDCPSEKVLFYSLRGNFSNESKEIEFKKIYDQAVICEDFYVLYQGKLIIEKENICLVGTWKSMEGTNGTFKAILQKDSSLESNTTTL